MNFAVDLVELEIASYDWAAMPCACGRGAAHVPADLRRFVGASERIPVAELFEGHLYTSATTDEPALPAAGVCLAALADELPFDVRAGVLALLLLVVGETGQSWSSYHAGRDLIAECQSAVRDGLWVLYAEVRAARSAKCVESAFEIISVVDKNTDRVELLRTATRDILPGHLREPDLPWNE